MRLESRKKIQIICLIAIILFLILFLKASYNQGSITKMGGDFTAYWASARLLIDGQNPYQADQILALQTSTGWTAKVPNVMYSPPWILPFVLPFALENYVCGKLLWLLFMFIITLICSVWLWQFYGGKKENGYCSLLAPLIYTPLYFCLVSGQIVPLILLGLVGFLHCEKQKKWFLAGIFVCLLGIKPQDTYLFLLALLFWIFYKKQWGILLGAVFTTLITATIPILYNPDIFFQYYTEILSHSYLYDWETPTLGYWLRSLLGKEEHFLQYLPAIVGTAWFVYYWYRNYVKWEWAEQVPILIFMSLMTTPYVWVNDYVLLLVAIIQASVWIIDNPLRPYSKFMIFIYVIINLMAWITAFTVRSEKWIIWMVPALFVNYLLVKKLQIDYEPQDDQCQKCDKLS